MFNPFRKSAASLPELPQVAPVAQVGPLPFLSGTPASITRGDFTLPQVAPQAPQQTALFFYHGAMTPVILPSGAQMALSGSWDELEPTLRASWHHLLPEYWRAIDAHTYAVLIDKPR